MAKRKRKQRTGQCVYCGAVGPVTKDHIPPKTLFTPPYPGNLITVFSCGLCNNGASNDDEYFFSRMVTNLNVSGHPETRQLSDKMLRGLFRDDKAGFREDFIRSLEVYQFSDGKGGMIELPTMSIDTSRILRVMNRIIRGLFFKEFSSRIPETYTVVSFAPWDDLPPDQHEQLKKRIDIITQGPSKVLGNKVFRYWVMPAQNDPFSTVWVFLFYESIALFGATYRIGALESGVL